ncbi:MAG TPA: hypothetical protein VIS52_04920 [Motiliproteus sp.]
MRTIRCIKAALPVVALSLSITAQANLSLEELTHQSEVIQRSLFDSSVTAMTEPNVHAEASGWLMRAKRNLEVGNLKTARSQLLEAGRLLYPMQPLSSVNLSDDKQRAWLNQIDAAIATLLPVAYDISAEKGKRSATLGAVKFLQDNGREALASGDLPLADRLLSQAYNGLQQEIVDLRSGDEFVIEQPRAATRAGWEDAERRFVDWRFSADWMIQMAEAMGTDPQLIRTGNQAADSLYREAQSLAQQANWQDATRMLDSAYRVMEQHWRQAGVDI